MTRGAVLVFEWGTRGINLSADRVCSAFYFYEAQVNKSNVSDSRCLLLTVQYMLDSRDWFSSSSPPETISAATLVFYTIVIFPKLKFLSLLLRDYSLSFKFFRFFKGKQKNVIWNRPVVQRLLLLVVVPLGCTIYYICDEGLVIFFFFQEREGEKEAVII